MACLITKGRLEPCKEFVGGLYKVWFANFGTVNPVLSVDNIVTALSGATTLFEYELKGTSKLAQDITSANGSTIVTQTLTLDLKGGDQNLNNEIKLLAYGRPHAFVQDNYGNNWLVGQLYGLDVTTGIHDTGAAKADKYGYTITMVGVERQFANFVSGSTIATPFGAIATAPTITKGV